MAVRPYLIHDTVSLAANGTGVLTYQVPNTETHRVLGWFHKSTGAFDVVGIRDSKGNNYGNMSSSDGMSNDFIPDVENAYNALESFPKPIELEGGVTLYIDILDTSGAVNSVELVLTGEKEF